MKKWICIILFLFFAGIAFMVYRYVNMDVEDHVKVAEKFKAGGTYENVIFSLEKALEVSLKKNGDTSAETARIYRILGAEERDLTKASEYLDRAYLIYEMENQMTEATDTLYENGVMWSRGLPATDEKMREAFQKVIQLYQENEYENSNSLVLSYYYLAYYGEDSADRLEYLKKGEAHIKNLTPNRKTEICKSLYKGIALIHAYSGENENALIYYDKIEDLLKDETEPKEKAYLADVYCLSGASLIDSGDIITAKAKLEKSIALFEEIGGGGYYIQMASAYTYLALSYAYQSEPDAEKMLECGKTAFSYYTGRKTLTNSDLESIEEIKAILREAYEKVYPRREAWEFDRWFGENIKMSATKYHFYTN